MNKKINGTLFGLFLIATGTLYLLRDTLPIEYGYIIAAIAGIELIISHFFNNGLLAVTLGSYLTYWGVLHIIQLDYLLSKALFASMIFFVPAIIFFILYIRQHKRSQLTWICLFFLLGIDAMINYLTGIDPIGALLVCVGIAFALDYILGGTYMYTSRLQLGIFLIVIGMLKLINIRIYISYILPIAIIWLGVIFFVKSIRKD